MHGIHGRKLNQRQARYRCRACGEPIEQIKQNGRRREYCDDACRVAGSRTGGHSNRKPVQRSENGARYPHARPLRNPGKNTEKTTPFLPVGKYGPSHICGPSRVIEAEIGGGFIWQEIVSADGVRSFERRRP